MINLTYDTKSKVLYVKKVRSKIVNSKESDAIQGLILNYDAAKRVVGIQWRDPTGYVISTEWIHIPQPFRTLVLAWHQMWVHTGMCPKVLHAVEKEKAP